MVVAAGPKRVRELMALGVDFQRTESADQALDLGIEGGHSARRIAHALDRTGSSIEESLLQKVAAKPAITVLENHLAVDLLIASRAEKDWRSAFNGPGRGRVGGGVNRKLSSCH